MRDCAYFITFRTYGTWLHGDARGSIDREHNEPGEQPMVRDDALRTRREATMTGAAVVLDTIERRRLVREAIEGTSAFRGWELLAVNVRTNHVHVVVSAEAATIERVLSDLKAWATRALRDANAFPRHQQVWSHHGSTRYLKSERALEAAVNYTLYQQGSALD